MSTTTPIAAIILPNAIADATPAAGNASTAAAAIGGQARPRMVSARGGAQEPQAPQAAQDGSSSSPSTGTPADAASASAKPATNADAAKAAVTANPGAQQTAMDNNTAAPQNGDATSTAVDSVAMRTDSAAPTSTGDTSGSTSAQSATAAVKAASTSLPNFGIAAATSVPGQAGTVTSASASAATVPISGLPVAIAARAVAGSNQFDIRLDPPELGRIDVKLDVDANGQVTSHVTVDRPETLTLLQSQQPQLERALEQAGLKTSDNGLQFSLRDQSFAGTNTGGNSGGSAQPNPTQQQLTIPDTDLSSVDTSQIYSRWSRGSGVDIRV